MFKMSFKIRTRRHIHGGKTFSKLAKEAFTPAERQVRQAVKSASSSYLADLLSQAGNQNGGNSADPTGGENGFEPDKGTDGSEGKSEEKAKKDKTFKPGTKAVNTENEVVWDLYEAELDLSEDEAKKFLNLESTVSLKVANTFRRVYKHNDFDFTGKVLQYNTMKNQLLHKYYKDDHVELSQEDLHNYNAELEKYTFKYWVSYVTVLISSDIQFANSAWDESRKMWIRVIKSKSIYTEHRISESFVESLRKEITSKDKLQKVTLEELSKVHIIKDPNKAGGLRMIPKGKLAEIEGNLRDPLGNQIDKDYTID